MEITLRNVPANSTITITCNDGNCIKLPIRARAHPNKFKTKYAGSKVVEFVLDGVSHSVTSQNEVKQMLMDSVKNKEHIPAWLRKGTSSNSMYRFIVNNKSIFKKFSIILKMSNGSLETVEN